MTSVHELVATASRRQQVACNHTNQLPREVRHSCVALVSEDSHAFRFRSRCARFGSRLRRFLPRSGQLPLPHGQVTLELPRAGLHQALLLLNGVVGAIRQSSVQLC